ncbi:TonB-dependent receptor [Mucilaginibacter sp. PAMB04168]|uniref:TonB-dependent receptor n=1 Tax=Mucilaginibacter sp. PAMB04168 TaxID=3138567 RepID=UPI0031F5F445
MKKLAPIQFKLILCLSLTVLFNVAQAQTGGKLSGKITDQKTGEALIGATLMVQGINKGTATNVNGEYSLTGVKAGTYSILIRYVGYQNKIISDVQIKATGVTPLNITLTSANSQQLQQVTVRATFRQESVNSLYAQQKNNAAITDGITSETIKRSPDKSASEVLRRVSGATVQDNKFVVVRGLGDRYNTALLDNTALPSTEPNRKAFSFDIVPSNLIDNLIINKTAMPNLPGDFAGGAVQIITRDIPQEDFTSINVGLGYNTNTTFKDFKSGYRNTTDYFGFDNGSHKLPGSFPSSTRVQSISTTNPEQSIAPLRSLNPNFNVYNTNAFLNQNYQVSLGRVKEVGKNGNKLGAIFAVTYRNSLQHDPNVINDFHVYTYNADRYKFSTNVGAIANFAYTFGKNKITFKNLYNKVFDDQYFARSGVDMTTGSADNRFTAFDLTEKSIYKGTLQGDHGLGNGSSKITWNASYSNVMNQQPDQRKTNYQLRDGIYIADVTSVGKQNARFFSDLNENIFAGDVNYSKPVKLFNQQATFKAGLVSQYRDRTFDVRFLGLLLNDNSPNASAVRQLPLNQIFSRSVINGGNFYLRELPNADERYTANAMTNAGYAMLDNKFGDKMRLVWGLRVEKFNLNLKTRNPSTPEVTLDNIDFLPSANFTYSLTQKANLRFSYSRTVARPELRELAPFGYYDYELLATITGNPSLKRSQIHNVDLRYEFYPSAGQIISISGFYKNFKNLIESGYYDVNSTPDFNFFNAQKANNYGVEFELRKTLDFIGPKFKHTTFYTNVAIIKSQVTDTRSFIADEGGKRPMIGQAPYVINGGLLQTAMDNKLSFNLLYNRVGERIYRARGFQFPAIYERSRDVVDAQIGYRVFKGKGEFKLNAGDILNQPTQFYYKNSTKQYNIERDGSIVSRFKSGSNYTLSYAYTF